MLTDHLGHGTILTMIVVGYSEDILQVIGHESLVVSLLSTDYNAHFLINGK